MGNKWFGYCNTSIIILFVTVSLCQANEDLLSEDEVSFDDSALLAPKDHWLDDLKTTFEHRHSQQPGDVYLQRSSVRLEFERAIPGGWYIRADDQYRYFWRNDTLAVGKDNAYGHNKWQELWVQFSQGACAVKAGRQDLIWGEVDGTFAVDIVTPFDHTEQLLTDYGNIRLAQDMLFSECFFNELQAQLFFVPDARTDEFYHYSSQITGFDQSVATGKEWGGRLKYHWEGGDISLMAARLYGNQPQLVAEDFTLKFRVPRFELIGISTSVAVRRLLLKMDVGYKTDQLLAMSDNTSDRLDAAFGFEYTTANNHQVNGGVWVIHYMGDNAPDSASLATIGWRKSWLNDDLSVSLLASRAIDRQLSSATLLAEYQWDDFWSFAAAAGYAETDDEALITPLIQPEKLLTLALKLEF